MGDMGGPFFSWKSYVDSKVEQILLSDKPRLAGATTTASYSGPMLPLAPTAMSYPTQIVTSKSGLDAWGAKAVAITKPTNAAADLSVFLGELFREGLPKLIGASTGLWKERTKEARKVPSEEYLNAQFGWMPIVRDMRSIANALYHADAVLRQYERDSGKLVRRKYEFPSESSLNFSTVFSNVVPWIPGGVSGDLLDPFSTARGTVYRQDSVERRRWFSGAFSYYLPPDYSSSDEMRRIALQAKKLLGLSLTPETVWNLSPWSWAVDWFSNVGDVLSNISDMITDNLVLQYGYMMEHTVQRRTYTYAGPTGAKTRDVRPSEVSFVIETKLRQRANPYGFGLTWSGLSPFQLSILAALGISKS